MNMIPLHQIGRPNYLVIQFKSYKNILMVENYCSDPDCSCGEVILNFAQLNEEQKITNNLLDIRIDLNTGNILETMIIEPALDADEILYEFHTHFYQFKSHLNENHQKVKAYFSTYQEETLPEDIIELIHGNNCVNYRKIFGDVNKIIIQHKDNEYLIEDQYCMKPSCLCDEVILIVYNPETQLSDFVFRLDLKTNQYELLKYNSNNDHDQIIKSIINQKKRVLQERYKRMKEVGQLFLT